MLILAIDTSCDDTSVAVVRGQQILSSVISSQIRYHKKYGGVVPFLAQRLHQERIGAVTELALSRAKCTVDEIEAIAVTCGPGLAPALQVGIAFAKELAIKNQKPLYAVNHMIGHLSSCFAVRGAKEAPVINYPLLAVLVSGGHTEFVYSEKFGSFKLLGQTLDDALGEAYDKVAKMLNLGYPGGPIVSKLAEKGSTDRYNLPIPMRQSKDYNLSYSGLKNAVRLLIESQSPEGALSATVIENICASFQYVAQQALQLKLQQIILDHPECKSILLAGGVAANTQLRWNIRLLARQHGISFHVPVNRQLCMDNAAMIGTAANLMIEAGQQPVDPLKIDRLPSLKIDEQITF